MPYLHLLLDKDGEISSKQAISEKLGFGMKDATGLTAPQQ